MAFSFCVCTFLACSRAGLEAVMHIKLRHKTERSVDCQSPGPGYLPGPGSDGAGGGGFDIGPPHVGAGALRLNEFWLFSVANMSDTCRRMWSWFGSIPKLGGSRLQAAVPQHASARVPKHGRVICPLELPGTLGVGPGPARPSTFPGILGVGPVSPRPREPESRSQGRKIRMGQHTKFPVAILAQSFSLS